MAMRAIALRLGGVKRAPFSSGTQSRASSGSGRVLSDEERAAESMYIKKMEKEKLEKVARQGVKPEEMVPKSFIPEPGSPDSISAPVRETSTDSTKNVAVAAGVVAFVAAGWWYFRANKKVKEEEKE